MNIRSKLTAFTLSAGLAVVGVAGLASPAHAALTSDTTTTFTLTGGLLAISGPGAKDLGSVSTSAGTTASVSLGNVTASDGRGALGAAWTASVSSTDFKTGTLTANETIAKANAFYQSNVATFTGVATLVPGQVTPASLSGTLTAYSASATVGNNTATWNPTVNVTIPAQAVVGAYSGTITHSIA